MLSELLHQNRAALGHLLAANRVSRLYAFGSSVTGGFTKDSDVDVLVEVEAPDEEAGALLINVWNGLEDILQRPVDLLTEASLRNPYLRAEIERTKQLIYDGSKGQVLV